MKFEKIAIQNFRQYFGKQEIQFAKEPDRNVTVIHGINGAGKTSFFLAMNWCLYGRTVDDVSIIANVGELMSKEAVEQAATGERVEMTVDLIFSHDERRYTVRRSLGGEKHENGEVMLDDADEFVMMVSSRVDPQAKRVANPLGTMNSILPANVREYFLFDGEKIDNFAKPEASQQVREAIYLVLDIEILERAKDHLDTRAVEYRRQLKQISGGELWELIEQEEQIHKDKTAAENRVTEVESEINSVNNKVAAVDEHLRNIQDARNLQQRRDRLNAELEQRRTELKSTISRLATSASGASAALAIPAIERAITLLDQKRERGEIPSGIRQQFVQDLLEQLNCICGRPFDDGSPEHERLFGLLKSRLPGSIEDDILDTHALLKQIPASIEQRQSALSDLMQQRTNLNQIIEKFEDELDDVGRQLAGSPLEEIGQLEAKRMEYLSDRDQYNLEMGALQQKIDGFDDTLAKLSKEINRAKQEKSAQRLLTKKRDLAQRSADAINEMHQLYADDMRKKIEAKTKEIFGQLIWKEAHFKDVQLGSDYNLSVIDRYGKPARPELSSGERQVLSLSFIAAMSEISEGEAPLVMDTPFGRLSSAHRNSITQVIPELADQLILFVTDEELRDVAESNLKPRIGAEYRLNFEDLTGCTQIEKVS